MRHFIMTAMLLMAILATVSTSSSCSKDEESITLNTINNKPEPEDTTSESDTIAKKDTIDHYDKIPAEHDIDYTVVSQKTYSSLLFFSTYISKAKTAMDGLSTSSLSGSGSSMKDVLKKLIESFSSFQGKLLGKYYVAEIKYTTVDRDNNPVVCSELLVWHGSNITDVLYANHGTRVGDFDSPTDGFTPEVFFATSGALVIIPDYLGAGVSSDKAEPYLVAQNNGDVAVDGYLAGIKYAKENISGLSADYSGYIVGYSQGGSVSLAALRSLQQRSEERQKMLNVKRVVCGDGPYDLEATFSNYLTQSSLSLPIVVPLVINGMMAGYPELVQNIDFNSCFTETALATGIPQKIHANTATTSELMSFFGDGASASEVLSSSLVSQSGNEYNTIISLLKRQNLCSGWEPKYPLLFIHDQGDTVVPYVNLEHALAGLKNSYVMDPIILNEGLDHGGGMLYMFPKIMSGELYK